MKVNAATYAKQLAESMDGMDKNGKDGKIESSIWNRFVNDKGGNQISNYININAAVKSLTLYLYKQAKSNSRLIAELGQEWINSFNNSKNNDNKVQSDKHSSKKNNATGSVKTNKRHTNEKKVDTSYSRISRDEALKRAKKDSRLEKLTGGFGWSVATDSFVTDIPYARKHTGKILSFVSSIIGENIIVTSALGTGGSKRTRSPHKVSQGYCSHHNAENPKLDIRTNGNSRRLRKKLVDTGLFSRVSIEPDHLDIQIKNEVYLAFENGYNMNNILACAKNNKIEQLIS